MGKPIRGPITQGVHHVGLTVRNVEETAAFFIRVLGFKEYRRDPDYPAILVTDGTHLISLWQVIAPDDGIPFDRTKNVGLHHLAFRVKDLATLNLLHAVLQKTEGVRIEFGPEPLRGGPTMHMMCYEPGGVRVEFIVPM